MQVSPPRLGRLGLGALLDEERPIHLADIDAGHLHTGAGDAHEVGLVDGERHRRVAGLRADEIHRLLIQADVALGELVSQVGHDAVQERGHCLMAAADPVVEVGKDGELAAVPLERHERLRQLEIGPGRFREECLVVGAENVRRADEPLDRARGLSRGPGRPGRGQKALECRQGEAHPRGPEDPAATRHEGMKWPGCRHGKAPDVDATRFSTHSTYVRPLARVLTRFFPPMTSHSSPPACRPWASRTRDNVTPPSNDR